MDRRSLILLGLVAALVTYKVGGSLATIARVQGTHTMPPRAEWFATAAAPDSVRPLLRAVNYLAIVAGPGLRCPHRGRGSRRRDLRRHGRSLARLVSPARERMSWRRLLRELSRSARSGS